MMINIENGYVNMGELIIYPYLDFAEVENKVPKNEIISCDFGNRIDLFLKPRRYKEHFFLLRLFFGKEDKALNLLHISVQDSPNIPSWDDWSQESELRNKNKNDKWLIEEIGATNKNYDWGTIKSVYSSLEGSSYIVIKYA